MHIYSNFIEIADQFDTLLVDAYGVFWGGKSPIPNSLETLALMVQQGKRVCILSNTTVLSDHAIQSYTRKGIYQGTHYTDLITSGDVCRHHLMTDNLPCQGHRVYPFGIMRWPWEDIPAFQIVSSPKEADMIFFGTPQITVEQLAQHPEYQSICAPLLNDSNCFNTTQITPFLSGLKALALSGLPAISTNPDLVVLENDYWVIRQGTFAQTYRDLGGTVFEFGKPYKNMYDYAFEKLGLHPSKRIAMIGDTYRTDIKGGLDSGISPVWCLDYGIAKYEENHGIPLLEQAGGSLDGITLIHHL